MKAQGGLDRRPAVRLRPNLRCDGPKEATATDATGTRDYGNIDSWTTDGRQDRLEGDWGCVVVDSARVTVEYID